MDCGPEGGADFDAIRVLTRRPVPPPAGNANPQTAATRYGGRHPLRRLAPPAGAQTWC